MVETGTSSYYTALADPTGEPVLQQVCRLIAADEYRHFKLFYDHMKRYLAREKLGLFSRLRIAAGRITETEDDELAYAFHCGNEPEGCATTTPAAPPATWPRRWASTNGGTSSAAPAWCSRPSACHHAAGWAPALPSWPGR